MGRFCPWFFTSSNWCDLMCHRKWSSEAMHSSWWGARMASCWSPCWNTFVNSQILGKNRLGYMSLGKHPRKRLKIQQVRAVSVASSLGGSYGCVCFSDRWIIHFGSHTFNCAIATWLQGLRGNNQPGGPMGWQVRRQRNTKVMVGTFIRCLAAKWKMFK